MSSRDKETPEHGDEQKSDDGDEDELEEEEEAAWSSREKVETALRKAGKKVEEELRRMVLIPEYLCKGMAVAMLSMNVDAGSDAARKVREEMLVEVPDVPEAPLVVLMKFCSDRRREIMFKHHLQKIIKKDQVFYLSIIQPSHFVQYGLAFLESYGQHDDCAQKIRKMLRVLVVGGNETVSSVLKSMEKIMDRKKSVPPVGIIPLGIGHDLSRSIGWGSSIPSTRSAVNHFLVRAAAYPVQALDSWQIDIITQENGLEKPYSPLKLSAGKYSFTKGDEIHKKLPENVSHFERIFYCNFTVGMDAQGASAFCHQVNPIPHLDEGTISNKLTYARSSSSQGWFFTPCTKTTESRKLKDILSLHIKGINKRTWKEIPIPGSIKAIAFLNIDNYRGGRRPWGLPKPEYLEEKKFYEANLADGLLEIIGLKDGCHTSMVMLKLISAKRIAQAAEIKLEFKADVWNEAYMQMDGQAIKMKKPTSSVEPLPSSKEKLPTSSKEKQPIDEEEPLSSSKEKQPIDEEEPSSSSKEKQPIDEEEPSSSSEEKQPIDEEEPSSSSKEKLPTSSKEKQPIDEEEPSSSSKEKLSSSGAVVKIERYRFQPLMIRGKKEKKVKKSKLLGE